MHLRIAKSLYLLYWSFLDYPNNIKADFPGKEINTTLDKGSHEKNYEIIYEWFIIY